MVTENVRKIKVKCVKCHKNRTLTVVLEYDLSKIENYVRCKNCGEQVIIKSISEAYEIEA